jgi:hypothetical protein
MKRHLLVVLALVVGLAVTGALQAADTDAIRAQVDEIVAAMDGGKTAADFADAAKREPHYVYIMEEDGQLLVHPSLVGQNLKEKAAPAYEAVVQATPEGKWVQYEWQGKEKNAYVRKTKNGLIVGSGY